MTTADTAQKHPDNKVRLSRDDRFYYGVTYVLLGFMLIIVLYPLVYIISSSFSSPTAVSAGKVVLWPVEPSLQGYQAVFENPHILTGYYNSIRYTLVGTLINVAMTMIAAYPLSRRDLPHRGAFMLLFTFTMLFNGGMIPDYILLKDLHMINKIWAIVLPGAISVYNLIITRTFLQTSIPPALLEAAQIDGCSDARYFVDIVLPLAKPVMAVITLYYAVGHWNAYFNAFLYLNDRSMFPLQLILREILLMNSIDASQVIDTQMAEFRQGMADLLKYSLIIVSSAPVLIMYPFVKKFFVKGVMIGSIKG